jgi:hypothetical protein
MKLPLRKSAAGPVVFMFILAGCSSTSPSASLRPVALAIVMADGSVPTRSQIAYVHAAVQPHLTHEGFVVASSPRAAERLLHVKLTPDPLAESGGRVEILSVASEVDRAAQSISARDEFRRNSEKAIRSQIYEPR